MKRQHGLPLNQRQRWGCLGMALILLIAVSSHNDGLAQGRAPGESRGEAGGRLLRSRLHLAGREWGPGYALGLSWQEGRLSQLMGLLVLPLSR